MDVEVKRERVENNIPPFRIIERLPELLYPWGRKAYRARLSLVIQRYGVQGAQNHAIDLVLWHALFHLLGALAFIAFVSIERSISPDIALYVSIVYTFWFAYQEFFDQRIRLRQVWWKAWFDFCTWTVPLFVTWYILGLP